MKLSPCIALFALGATAHADPHLTSWFTENSTVLARVIQTTNTTTGTHNTTPVTTWPTTGITTNNNGSAAQTVPVYADVQQIRYDANYVYINAHGLPSYTMGPWLTNGSGLFGFWPLSKSYQVRFPFNPGTPPVTKTRHGGGMIGMMVNGVAIYDLGDAFGFVQTANTPTVTGSDSMGSTSTANPWWRDALAVEVVTFDPGYAHQPGVNGQYHYHAEPKALRYQLGDNMTTTYNGSPNNTYSYTENISSLHHSPIIGWCFDGYPIYGPYAYSDPTSAASAVTRMRSGFVLRNAANHTLYGTANIDSTGRTTLPKWAAIAEGFTYVANSNGDFDLSASLYGPATTYQTSGPGGLATYSLGRYVGDYDFLGDRGQTQGPTGGYDLDQYNGRFCVTPEFPAGTYAYFVTNDATGSPAFPYMLGKQYYGNPTAGGSVSTVPAGAATFFNGGPNTQEVAGATSVSASGTVTITWSGVEGATYNIETSNDLSTWSGLNSNVAAAVNTILPAPASVLTESTFTDKPTPFPIKRFYRVTRTGIATYTP